MERLLEEISFDAPEMKKRRMKIDAGYVKGRLETIAKNEDLSQFIL